MSNACLRNFFSALAIPQRRGTTHCTKLIQCSRATSHARLNANNASRAQQLIAAALPDVRAPFLQPVGERCGTLVPIVGTIVQEKAEIVGKNGLTANGLFNENN
jgi:hypothetical protein